MSHCKVLILSLLLLMFAPTVLAQVDCPTIVQTALEAVDNACESLSRNQACYGNVTLNATPRDGTADFQFEQAGDIADIANLQSLQLSSLSLTDETWGVALLKLQANLPDTLPGQNVTFLLFGDVKMTDANAENVERPVTATGGVNVRLRPNTDASVLLSLRSGQEVTATGQLADGSWIRVRLEDGTSGWVSADFLRGELGSLLHVEPGSSTFGPMQAFYFTTGLNDAPCEDAPNSGILVQTPEGAGTIQLRANGVDIQLGSTAYLQAATSDAMYVSVIEGHATLTVDGASQIVPAGTVSRVPLDANGLAAAAPEFPQPYAFRSLKNLPVNLRLFTPVEVERATANADIADAIAALTSSNAAAPGGTDQSGGSTASDSSLPRSGNWVYSEEFIEGGCGEGAMTDGFILHLNLVVTFSDDRSTVVFDDDLPGSFTWSRIDDITYGGSPSGSDRITIVFTSPTTFSGTFVGDVSGNTPAECVVRTQLNGHFVG